MSTSDGIALSPQVFREIRFHLKGGFVRHGIEILVELWKEPECEILNVVGALDSLLMILKSFFGVETGHADIDTREGGLALGVCPFDAWKICHIWIELNDVDVMMGLGARMLS